MKSYQHVMQITEDGVLILWDLSSFVEVIANGLKIRGGMWATGRGWGDPGEVYIEEGFLSAPAAAGFVMRETQEHEERANSHQSTADSRDKRNPRPTLRRRGWGTRRRRRLVVFERRCEG